MSYWGYKPYVSVAQRRADAAKQVKLLLKKGQTVSPVVIEGRRIAASFWGKAWCDNDCAWRHNHRCHRLIA